MDFGETLPWGLTVGQTLLVGIGGIVLLVGWTILSALLRLSRNILMCGLVVLAMLLCCGSIAVAAYQLTK